MEREIYDNNKKDLIDSSLISFDEQQNEEYIEEDINDIEYLATQIYINMKLYIDEHHVQIFQKGNYSMLEKCLL